MKNIAIIILAAGESKRMGKPKQLLPWKKTSLLGHCIEQSIESHAKEIFVVLGAHYDKIYQKHAHYKVNFLNHKNWNLGLSHSIKFGLNHIKYLPFDGVLLLLSDQPQIDSEYINDYISTAQKTTPQFIIASIYKKNYGVPILFSTNYYDHFLNNTNPKGGHSILKVYDKYIYPIQPKTMIKDIDTIEEYNLIYKLHH